MRLEVLIENSDPVVYPLSNQKITIGSSEVCDIILSSDGVSRKHVSITSEGDNFFVVDLGSSNGSFINEERLIPGKRAEFTSFFPVRLGQSVLLTLLSDEEAQTDGLIEIPISFKGAPTEKQADIPQDQTRIINLKDLSKQTTEKLITNRNEKRVELKSKDSKTPTKKKKSNLVSFLAFFILVGGASYNFIKLKENKESDSSSNIKNIDKSKGDTNKSLAVDGVQSVKQNANLDLIPEEDFVKKSTYENIIFDLKCVSEEEKALCLYFPGTTDQPFGVVQIGSTFNALVDGSVFIGHARNVIKKPVEQTPEALENYNRLIYATAAYIYLLRATSGAPLETQKFKDFKLSIALYEKIGDEFKLVIVIAIKPEVLNKLKDVVIESHLELIVTNGFSALEVVKRYYTTF